MIANPSVPAFRYDPYSKKLTRERYDHKEMQTVRHDAVVKARKAPGGMWGVVLGTLGRQGNFKQLQVCDYIPLSTRCTDKRNEQAIISLVPDAMPILLSELSPAKLALFDIGAFVQTSCPRLSIDWGYAFEKPLLTPYECRVAVGDVTATWDQTGDTERGIGEYPMDFYAAGSAMSVARVKSSFR